MHEKQLRCTAVCVNVSLKFCVFSSFFFKTPTVVVVNVWFTFFVLKIHNVFYRIKIVLARLWFCFNAFGCTSHSPLEFFSTCLTHSDYKILQDIEKIGKEKDSVVFLLYCIHRAYLAPSSV